MREPTGAELIEMIDEVAYGLSQQPVRLRDIRARTAQLEQMLEPYYLKRTALGDIAGIVMDYYPLPEQIALYRREQAVYHEHVKNGDFTYKNYKNVLITDAYGFFWRWMDRSYRYPYGDVRLLRPLIGEVLVESAEWERSPYPDESAELGEWYEELAPGGALYPTDEHLDYVARFEAFAENIVWDSRGQEYITIVNFPPPPNALPPTRWRCTQHILSTRPPDEQHRE